MNDSIFRHYDIRGKVGIDFQIHDAYKIGQAIAAYFKEKKPQIRAIAIGIDGRTSSPAIREQVESAFLDAGIDVYYIGMCPTPVLYFTLFTNDHIDGGLMITASHNGPAYNGIKICLNKKIVALEEIGYIKDIFRNGILENSTTRGELYDLPMHEPYLNWLCDHFSHLKDFDRKIAIDCGSGATATIIPDLIKRMNWKNATVLFDEIDGEFSHHLPDPTIEANVADLKEFIKKEKCILGAAFDGDGDRMVPVTETGDLVSGDKMLALYVQEIAQEKEAFSVVFDVKSSSKLVDLLRSWNLVPIMSATGHAYIKKNMHEHNSLVGGEISCHFFFCDRYFGFDDGIYALLRLIEIAAKARETLSTLLSIFPASFTTQEIRISCADQHQAINAITKNFASRVGVNISTIDGARVSFSDGWALIRASNTEPLLSMRFEADGQEGLIQYKKEFASILKEYVDERLLCEKLEL